MQDPRIEAAAKALYGDVNKSHANEKGWDEVLPRWQESYRGNARAALAAADYAATITTGEELDALPAGAVLIDSYQSHLAGDVYRKELTLNADGKLGGVYWQAGPQGAFHAIALPARVIHWGQA